MGSGATMFLDVSLLATTAGPAELPAIDASYIAGLVSRVLHILSAIILGGSLFYLRTVLAPAGAEACFAGRREVWARWVHVAIGLLLASGVYNFLVLNGQVVAEGGKLPPTYHMLFGIKVLLGLGVMFIASLLAGKTSLAERIRTDLGKWLKLSWLGVIAIVVLAAVMRTLH